MMDPEIIWGEVFTSPSPNEGVTQEKFTFPVGDHFVTIGALVRDEEILTVMGWAEWA